MREEINSIIEDIDKIETQLEIIKIRAKQLSEGVTSSPVEKQSTEVPKNALQGILTKNGLPVNDKYIREIRSIANIKQLSNSDLEKIFNKVNEYKEKEINKGNKIGSIEKITYKFMYNYK